jgi:hypothetical protein
VASEDHLDYVGGGNGDRQDRQMLLDFLVE